MDDELTNVKMIETYIKSLGYLVTPFTSPGAALKEFKESPEKFDLVITDMTMPEMTGEKLVTQLLTIRNDLPIVLCTGYSELMNAEKAKSIGIKSYVTKPIILTDLAKTLRKVLDESFFQQNG